MTKGERAMRNHVIAGVRCDAEMYQTITNIAEETGLGQAGVIRDAIRLLFDKDIDAVDKFISTQVDEKTAPRNCKLNNTYLDPEEYADIRKVSEYSGVSISGIVRIALRMLINEVNGDLE